MNLKKRDLIFLLLFFILFYRSFFKTEKMTDDSNNIKIMKDLIDANYSIDVDAIRNLSTVANDLISNDQLKIPSNLNVVGSVNFLPKGTIVAWNGSKVPQGWALCDGKNNTPDLRGRFILGSGSNWKGSGGSSTKNIQLANINEHRHATRAKWEYGQRYYNVYRIKSEGSSQPMDIMPPYYVLAWIMRTI